MQLIRTTILTLSFTVAATHIDNIVPGSAFTSYGPGTYRACRHLSHLISLFPSPGSPDDRPDDPDYQVLRSRIVSVLDTFVWVLSTQRALDPKFARGALFWVLFDLRDHGQRLGLMSQQLKRAIVGYWDAYAAKVQRRPDDPHPLDQWIQMLRCDLDIHKQVCMSMSQYDYGLRSLPTSYVELP